MAAIQCWDREQIDKTEDEGQEGCHLPKPVPVPSGWEHGANGQETAEAVTCFDFAPEHLAKGADLAAQKIDPFFKPCRHRLGQGIFLMAVGEIMPHALYSSADDAVIGGLYVDEHGVDSVGCAVRSEQGDAYFFVFIIPCVLQCRKTHRRIGWAAH